jgi:hypothetical protein
MACPSGQNSSANFTKSSSLAAIAPSVYNYFVRSSFFGKQIKRFSGFAEKRSIQRFIQPHLEMVKRHQQEKQGQRKKVFLFCDEFTNYSDMRLALRRSSYWKTWAMKLQSRNIWKAAEPGCRRVVEKGKANRKCKHQASAEIITDETPLIGIEPSCYFNFFEMSILTLQMRISLKRLKN